MHSIESRQFSKCIGVMVTFYWSPGHGIGCMEISKLCLAVGPGFTECPKALDTRAAHVGWRRPARSGCAQSPNELDMKAVPEKPCHHEGLDATDSAFSGIERRPVQ